MNQILSRKVCVVLGTSLIALLSSTHASAFTVSPSNWNSITINSTSSSLTRTNSKGTLVTNQNLQSVGTIFISTSGLSMFSTLEKSTGILTTRYKSCKLVIDEDGAVRTNVNTGDGNYDPNACNTMQTLADKFRQYMNVEYSMPFTGDIEDDIDEIDDATSVTQSCVERGIYTGIAIAGAGALVAIGPASTAVFIVSGSAWFSGSMIAIEDLRDACPKAYFSGGGGGGGGGGGW